MYIYICICMYIYIYIYIMRILAVGMHSIYSSVLEIIDVHRRLTPRSVSIFYILQSIEYIRPIY